MPIEKIPIWRIRLDGDAQPRAALNMVVAGEYADAMREGALFPPINVRFDGTAYWPSDGWHRIHGAQMAGFEEILADVQPGGDLDAQWDSCAANQTHGLQRTNDDKARAVQKALMHPEGAGKSDSQIARHCGVAVHTVGKYRAELEASLQIAKIDERQVTRGGATYTQTVTNIGRRPAPVTPAAFFENPPEIGIPASRGPVFRPDFEDAPESPAIGPWGTGDLTAMDAVIVAEELSRDGDGLTREEWDAKPDGYLGECYKQCYSPRWMDKGSIYEYGVHGVYVCSGCGYAYPPGCAPGPATQLEMFTEDEEEGDDPEELIEAVLDRHPEHRAAIDRARLAANFATAQRFLRDRLLCLDPEELAALEDLAHGSLTRAFVTDLKDWIARFEAGLNRGLRAVK